MRFSVDKNAKWSPIVMLLFLSLTLTGCTYAALRSEYVRSAIRQNVEGVEARFNVDVTGTCIGPFSSFGVATKASVAFETGRPACLVVRFSPNVSDLDRRLELARKAVVASTRLRDAGVENTVIKKANLQMLKQDRRGQLDPVDLVIPAFVCPPNNTEICL
mmetsp:Transcript_23619/g.41880  ORF Transcript_23619/g.41880 Transcript_23619/m.41880 type:complete len:161 (-) Transcript_23619:4065-4547(-)